MIMRWIVKVVIRCVECIAVLLSFTNLSDWPKIYRYKSKTNRVFLPRIFLLISSLFVLIGQSDYFGFHLWVLS